MEENKVVIKKKEVLRIIEQSGNAINSLARFLDIFAEDSTESSIQDEKIADIDLQSLPSYLIAPYNISFMTIVTPKDDMVFTTVLSDRDKYGFYSYLKESELLTLKTVEPQEIIDLSSDLIGTRNALESETKLFFTPTGILALSTLVDLVRRESLEKLVLHLVGESEITISKIQEILEMSMDSCDIRWLTPFILDIFDPLEIIPKEKMDIKEGIKELGDMGLLKLQEDIVQLTDRGRDFLDLLIEPSGRIGVKSLYYYSQKLELLSSIFISIANNLYYIMNIDGGKQYSWASIDYEKFEEVLGMNIAPGEIPPLIDISSPAEVPIQEPVQESNPDNRVNFCIYCGTALTPNAKFCRKCGKSLEFK